MARTLSNYDLHHFCLYIHKFKPGCKTEVIPSTDKKYITLTVGVPVTTYEDKNGMTKTVFEYLRFIDSYRFMAFSLEKLAGFLPQEKFKILDGCYADYSTEDISLIHQKGYYPYSYFDNFDKFLETKLPPRDQWKDSLRNGAIMVTQEEWKHADNVFQTFGCLNLGDYHDLYLKTDTLLLACVFEEFRSLCYKTYGLDSAHYFTCSHLSGDAFLKPCKADIELLTDREHLEMVENMIRGGVATVFDKKFFKANNRYVAEHNFNNYNTYGVLLDANNLFGGIMEKFPLPTNSFETVQEYSLERILATTNNSEYGFILEVDLHYPDRLHDGHEDFPLAPTKEQIYYKSLGERQQALLEVMGETRQYSHGKKLIQTLADKNNYTLHYLTLKLYVSLGMKVKKVHRVLKFRQSQWLQPYMELNTQKRKECRKKFEESFFKLMNNSCNEDKNGMTKTVFEYLRFIDSYRFMAFSLEKLAGFLPQEKFRILDGCYSGYSTEDISLIHQKGYYPYSYFDNFDKLLETKLPPRDQWKDSLRNGAIMVTQEEWKHADNVFQTFGCLNLGDYHDLYLKTDTLLLACVFEEFRSLCYKTYGLDSAHYFTCSHLSGDAFLKPCKADIELLTDREHLEMVENMIRGGVATVFDKKFFKANNRYVAEHNFNNYNTYGVLLDANNLFGGIMEKFPLPTNSFETVQEYSLERILATTNNSEYGFILEVDLHYPDRLHDGHEDFPLAPTKEQIYYKSLGERQQELLEVMGETRQYSHGKKLIQTLADKNNYTLHYLTLKLYVSLGMKVKKVHRVLKFRQSQWLQPYMELNTQKRKECRKKFEESFFKLMNNSCYGKTLESKRNRLTVQLVTNRDDVLRRTDTPFFHKFKIFNENLAAISSTKRSFLWNKPTIVGATVLDLAKLHMFDFHYNVKKKHFNSFVFYSDTDSLLYEIKHTDFYEELATNEELRQHFDLSNYPSDHFLYNVENKMVTLKFKDELAGEPIEEFVGLKPKMYSILVGGRQKLSANGVCRFAQKDLNHDLYKNILQTGNSFKTINKRIGSEKHQLQTIKTNKVSLSSFDDKRFILEDGISILPHGHYMIRDVHVTQDIIDEPDWGNEEDEEEMPTSPKWDELIGNDPVNTVTQIFPEEQQNAQVVRVPEEIFTQGDDEPITLTQELMEAWSPPDLRFNQREYSDSELEDVVNLDESFVEQNPPRNPFFDDEATEASDTEGEPVQKDEQESDPNDCMIVETLTEDEVNAIEDQIDFDTWFSDDDFINRTKRAKRRRLEIVSDSESE